jgi:hypothetical protein
MACERILDIQYMVVRMNIMLRIVAKICKIKHIFKYFIESRLVSTILYMH